MSMLPPKTLERIAETGVVAVLVVDQVERAVPLARALLAGGVDVMELTLRTAVALDALRAIKNEVAEMIVGAGTVLRPEQVRQVAEAGAAFAVAPGMNPRVVQTAQAAGLPFMPGVATPSDIEQALECGCRELKFFPAEPSGGLNYLKNVAAPYAHLNVRYIPLGGISPANAGSYLEDSQVLAVGGSWIAKREMIQAGNWAAITRSSAEARALVKQFRK